jgi:hypothetical protein
MKRLIIHPVAVIMDIKNVLFLDKCLTYKFDLYATIFSLFFLLTLYFEAIGFV